MPATPAEGGKSLAPAVERLRDAVDIEPPFQALGIDEGAVPGALPQQALNAYEDQPAPANPPMPTPMPMPMLDGTRELVRTAYYGRRGETGTNVPTN